MNQETRTPSSVLALCRELDVKIISLRFTDFLGRGRLVRIPFSELREESFEYGFGLNPAGIACLKGQGQGNGDLLLVPQPETSFFDPFSTIPTLNLLCGLQDPTTREDLKTDARSIAIKAMAYLASCGFADRATVGAELEFHLLPVGNEGIRHAIAQGHHAIAQGHHGMTQGHHGMTQAGISGMSKDDVGPTSMMGDESEDHLLADDQLDFTRLGNSREFQTSEYEDDFFGFIYAEIIKHLTACKVQIDAQRLRCSYGKWLTIGIRGDDPVRTADAIIIAKYVIRSVARRYNRTAMFLPKLAESRRGCGMPLNVNLYRGGEALLAGSEFGGLSSVGMGAIGGLLKHLSSLCGLVSPSTNSYRRFADTGRDDTPTYATYSRGLQNAVVRIPAFSSNPKDKRIEFACPDATSNPYIGISATLMAMVEGAQNKIEPGPSLDEASHDGRIAALETVPQSLEEALGALEIDHDYLTRGGVFVPEFVESWIECKRLLEVGRIRLAPHPNEMKIYGDL